MLPPKAPQTRENTNPAVSPQLNEESHLAWGQAYQLFDQLLELSAPADRLAFIQQQPDPSVRSILTNLLQNASSDAALLRAESLSQAVRPGARISRYELGRQLGRGGAGRVYEAVDTELGRSVAIKFLAAASPDHPRLAERLIREAQTASALNHPGIVTIYEVLRHEGEIGLVMELVEGQSLSRFRQGGVPASTLIRWGRQLAQVLAATHARGIVHRDIKPENIMLRPDGLLKVLDFGLAQLPDWAGDPHLSRPLPCSGTPRYMAPELFDGQNASPASDMYALGVLLFELAAPRPDLPPQSSAAPGPPALLHLFRQLLLADPAARPTAQAFDQQLAAFESIAPALASATRQPLRKLLLPLAGMLLLATLGVLIWMAAPDQASPRFLNSDKPFLELVALPSFPEDGVEAAALSPDGESVAFFPTGGQLTVAELSSGARTNLPTPKGLIVARIAWLANQRQVLVSGFPPSSRTPSVWLFPRHLPADAKPPKPLLLEACDAVASPDGSRIAFLSPDRTTLFVARADGSQSRSLHSSGPAATLSALVWLTNGRHLAALHLSRPAATDLAPTQTFQVINSHSGQVTASVPGLGIISPVALADGRLLALPWAFPWESHGGNLLDIQIDPGSGVLRQVTRHKMVFAHDALYSNFSASGDGARMILIAAPSSNNLHLARLEGAASALRVQHLQPLTNYHYEDYPHAWSHDSRTIFFESDQHQKTYGLYRYHLAQHRVEPLFLPPSAAVLPHITPDGQWLLYLQKFPPPHKDPRDYDLMRLPLNSTGAPPVPQLLLKTTTQPEEFRCGLQSGSRCVIRTHVGKQFLYRELHPLTGPGAELARVPAQEYLNFDWDLSPDGTSVAMPNHDPLSAQLRFINLRDGSERSVSLAGLSALGGVAWAADGQGVFVSAALRSGGLVAYSDLQGNWHRLFDTRRRSYVVPSPDGQYLAFPDRLRAGSIKVLHRP